MDATVIICTYNRRQNLPDCFDALESQVTDPATSWEVLLVDNNCTDDTANYVLEYATNSPLNVRYVFESAQGLSHARNRGIQDARGEHLIFIDDDIRVSQDWLRSILYTFSKTGCDAVGGRIEIRPPRPLPAWITTDMYGFLGHQDFGEHSYRLDGRREFPFGGNMAFKRHVFDHVGTFDTEMGRKGAGRNRDELFKGEETDFFRRLSDTGAEIYYQPSARVYHKVEPHQLEKTFFRVLHYNAGVLKARRDPHHHPRTLHGIPLFLFPQTWRALFRYLRKALSVGPNGAFRQQMTVGYFLGMMHGYSIRSQSAPGTDTNGD